MIEQELPTIIRSNNRNNVATSQERNAVKILAIFEMIICILTVGAGVGEVVIASQYHCFYFDHYYYYSNCFYFETFGQAMWCSIFPFIASIIGIVAGKSPTIQKIRLLMGFSIVAVFSLIGLVLLELYHLSLYTYRYYPDWSHRWNIYRGEELYFAYFGLQWGIFGSGAINLILMFTSACYSCCMGNQNNGVGQGNIVVSYGGHGGQPVYSVSSGMQVNPQQQQQPQVVMNPTQLQQVSSGQFTNPVFYTQPQMQQREPTQFIMMQREMTQPQILQREMTQPQILQREMTQPQIIQREMTQPQILQREMTQPQIIQREMTQPQIVQREMTQPQIVQREMTQPQILQREMTQSQIVQREPNQPQLQQNEAVGNPTIQKIIRDDEPQSPTTEEQINLPQQVESLDIHE